MSAAPTVNADEALARAPRHRIYSLDSMRGIAALVVLIHHSLAVFPDFGGRSDRSIPQQLGWLPALCEYTPLGAFRNGAAAVMLFFVLSGIALSLALSGERRDSYPIFVLRRICRIYIPYIAVLVVAALLWARLSPFRPIDLSEWFEQTNWNRPLGWGSLVDYGLMLGGDVSLDNVIWSLDYEMRISLVFPFLLWLGSGRSFLGPATIAVIMLVASLFRDIVPRSESGLSSLVHSATLSLTARYSVAFLIGTIISQAIPALGRVKSRHLPLLLLGFGILVMWRFTEDYIEMLGATAILVSAILPGPVQRGCMHAVPRFLGRISYSLYLVQLPVMLAIICILYGRIGLPGLVLVAFPICIFAAWLFNLSVEEPTRKLGGLLANRLRDTRLFGAPPTTNGLNTPAT